MQVHTSELCELCKKWMVQHGSAAKFVQRNVFLKIELYEL